MKKIAIILMLASLILLCGCSSNENQKEDASTTGASSVLEENPSNPIPLADFTTEPITDNENTQSQTEANKLPNVEDDKNSSTADFTLENSSDNTNKKEPTTDKNETTEHSTTAMQDFEMPRIPIN